MIYLDNCATTKIFDEILKKYDFLNRRYFYNPNSIYPPAQETRNEIEKVRQKIANILKTDEENVIFTSSATEANNTIIRSIEENTKKNEILVSPIEHKSVLNPVKYLVKKGFKVKFLKIDNNGLIDLDDLNAKISSKTAIVCVIHTNNETGVIQDIKSIGKICKEKQVPLFSDVVQGFLKEDISLDKVDYISVSAHKLNAPKGVGVLAKNKDISPLLYGGGQEFGYRSGTLNSVGIISFGMAIDIWLKNKKKFLAHMENIRNSFEKMLKEKIPNIIVVSEKAKRAVHISNIIFPKVDAQSMVIALGEKGVFVSSGSACSSGTPSPSSVLLAYGFSERQALSSIRFSFGIFNNIDEIKQAVDIISATYKDLCEFF